MSTAQKTYLGLICSLWRLVIIGSNHQPNGTRALNREKIGRGGRAYSLSAGGFTPVAPMVEKACSDLFSTNPCYAGRSKGWVAKLLFTRRYPVRNARNSGHSTLTSAGTGKGLRSVRTPFGSRMQA